jgi:hypothetical protein
MPQFTTRSGHVLGTFRNWPIYRHLTALDSLVDYIFTHDVLSYNKEGTSRVQCWVFRYHNWRCSFWS